MLRSPPVPGKFQYRWLGPYVVVKRISSLTYEINLPGASENVIVHVNRLKKSPPPADSELPSEPAKKKERTTTQTRRTPEKGKSGHRVTKANDGNSCRSGRSSL